MGDVYDVVAEGWGEGFTMEIEERYSSSDVERVIRYIKPDGTLDGQVEEIRKDGVIYHRQTGGNVIDEGIWVEVGEYRDLALPIPCLGRPIEGPVPLGGLAQTWTWDVPDPQAGKIRYEYWVDVNGRPDQARQTFLSQDEAIVEGVVDYWYSGYGEPNEIVAPIVGTSASGTSPVETPTPGPAPTQNPATPTPVSQAFLYAYEVCGWIPEIRSDAVAEGGVWSDAVSMMENRTVAFGYETPPPELQAIHDTFLEFFAAMRERALQYPSDEPASFQVLLADGRPLELLRKLEAMKDALPADLRALLVQWNCFEE